MTVTFPRTDIQALVGFTDQTFQLKPRQETSRTADGRTYGKDFGLALWFGTWTTVDLPDDEALAFEAKLNSLDGLVNTFEAGDLRRQYPLLHADGDFSDTGVIASASDGRKIALSGLDAGMKLSAGDYLSFDYGSARRLHQLLEAVEADSSGDTTEFEVRPHLPPGLTLSPSIEVRLKRPCALFKLLPDTIRQQMTGGLFTSLSFQAVQSI
jgi:hypothetical protein